MKEGCLLMCSYGNAEIYYNQNRKIFPRSQSAGECALQCSVRVFLIYTKCVQEHCIPGPTGAGFLGLLLMLFVCLFVYSCSEQRGIMGQSCWVSSRHGHALLLSAPSATSLL